MKYFNHLDKLPVELHYYIADILESDRLWRIEEYKYIKYTLNCIDRFNVFKMYGGVRFKEKIMYSHFINHNKPIVKFMYKKYINEYN